MKRIGGFLVGATILSGCSFNASAGEASLSQGDAEELIATNLTESVGVAPESVDCDGISDVEVEEGNTFICTGTAPNGDLFDIDVTLTDDEGGFSFVVPS